MTSTHSTQQLIEENQGLVRSLAWKVHRRMPEHVDFDDLAGYGQVGLAEAARDYDPARGSAFSTFAYYRIRGAIYDGLAKMSWHSRSHYRNIRYQQLADDVLSLDGDSGQRADTESFENHVQWLKRMTGTLAVVYLAATAASEEEGSELELADPSVPAPSAAAIEREAFEKLRKLIDGLPDESATLIRSVYFEGLTLQEAGKRIGISKAWASRLHARILGQLARALRHAGVAE